MINLILIGIYCIAAVGFGPIYTKIPIHIGLSFPIFPSEILLLLLALDFVPWSLLAIFLFLSYVLCLEPDGYTMRNIAMFLYPIYGFWVFKNFNLKSKLWVNGIALALLVYLLSYTESRSQITGLMAMAVILLFTINGWGQKVIILWVAVIVILVADPARVQSLFAINKTIHTYAETKKTIEQKEKDYKPVYILPQSYAPSHQYCGPLSEKGEIGNSIFRLLIWQDMVNEMISKHAWLGMGFSHPLRSKQIEAGNMASGEWSRDGWISAHNSWLYIIYRTGIFGLIAVGYILYLFFDALFWFNRIGNVTGIILCGCLAYWFVAAFTMVSFELPYHAIPIWCLLGLIRNVKNKETSKGV